MTGGVLHQGIGLSVPPYAYEPFDDLVADALEQTDAAARGARRCHRSAQPGRRRTVGGRVRRARRVHARAAGRRASPRPRGGPAPARRPALPIAQVTNLTRALRRCQDEGFTVVGLDADGSNVALRPGGGGRPAGGRGRFRGPRSVAAGRRDLRLARRDPDVVRGRVAERVRRRGGHAGRDRPAPDRLRRSAGRTERHCELRRETRRLRREASAIYAGAGAAAARRSRHPSRRPPPRLAAARFRPVRRSAGTSAGTRPAGWCRRHRRCRR